MPTCSGLTPVVRIHAVCSHRIRWLDFTPAQQGIQLICTGLGALTLLVTCTVWQAGILSDALVHTAQFQEPAASTHKPQLHPILLEQYV